MFSKIIYEYYCRCRCGHYYVLSAQYSQCLGCMVRDWYQKNVCGPDLQTRSMVQSHHHIQEILAQSSPPNRTKLEILLVGRVEVGNGNNQHISLLKLQSGKGLAKIPLHFLITQEFFMLFPSKNLFILISANISS